MYLIFLKQNIIFVNIFLSNGCCIIFSVNSIKGIILNGIKNPKWEKGELYPMKKSVSKKTKDVIEKELERINHMNSLMEITRAGARMMLQIAIEEELTAFLERDYYERIKNNTNRGYRSGYKPRTIKTGSGDITINMPQVRNTESPFHSRLLPPYTTRWESLPLL